MSPASSRGAPGPAAAPARAAAPGPAGADAAGRKGAGKPKGTGARKNTVERKGDPAVEPGAATPGTGTDDSVDRKDGSHGGTLPSRMNRRLPRLPHEHDQSADSQSEPADPVTSVGQQGHDDVSRGLVDTDRGPAMDKLYNEKVKAPAARAPRKRRA